jgi:hypothetical protein
MAPPACGAAPGAAGIIAPSAERSIKFAKKQARVKTLARFKEERAKGDPEDPERPPGQQCLRMATRVPQVPAAVPTVSPSRIPSSPAPQPKAAPGYVAI